MTDRGMLTLRGVSKSFQRGGRESLAVENIELSVKPGELFCLLGPSGCGKTTILNMIAGFEAPSSGTIEMEGKALSGPGNDRGVIFQTDSALFSWLTAVENVEFGPRMRGVPRATRREAAMTYIELVGLGNQERKYPHELSGGMKQRVQLARVLANDPKVLLMDEPFAALDAQTRRQMQRELVELWERTGKTIFMITHDIDEALVLADRVGVMRSTAPGHLDEIIPVGLPRPRSRSPEFAALFERIDSLLSTGRDHA
jgi:NitT/TauT family transport system ATP-binding protein